MRKALALMTIAVAACLFLSSWVPYGFNHQKITEQEKLNLAAYQSLLWKISPEHVAGKATEFNNAIHQYNAVIQANLTSTEGYQNLAVKLPNSVDDYRIIIAQKNHHGKYTLSYNAKNYDRQIPAVVVDLDETMIDNSLHGIQIALSKNGFTPHGFHQWVKAMKAPLYSNAIRFVEHVWQTGGIVLFASNRNMGADGGNGTGDELGYTRQNLINFGYPTAFLDSYTWWMSGVLPYGDQQQTKTNLAKLKSKEERYNYLNKNETKLQTRTMEAMNLNQKLGDLVWTDVNDNSDFSGKVNVKIVMKIGDDLNDFNSNLLTHGEPKKSLDLRHQYVTNQNIHNLFGGIAPAVWFTKNEQAKIVEHVAKSNQTIDQNLVTNQHVHEIVEDTEPLLQTYTYISGNANYGNWLNTFRNVYGHNLTGMKMALQDYFNRHGGKQIWN